MSKSTLEKMARAICENDGHKWPDGTVTDPYNDRFQRRAYEKMARAALAVVMTEMRTPSEEMWHAGALAGSQGRTRAIWGWQAMLAQFEKENTGG